MSKVLQRTYRPVPTLGPLSSWCIGGFRVGPALGRRSVAASLTWVGLGANDNWSSSGNWGGLVPINGDTLIFNGSTRPAPVNNLVGLSVASVTVNTGVSFNITGNGISMSSGSVTTLGASTQTIALPLAITGTNLFPITPNTAYSGLVSGSGAITKSGAGALTLTAANTYTGVTTVSAGTLIYQNTYASSSHVIAAGSVLEFNVASGTRDGSTTSFSGGGAIRKTGAGTIQWPSPAATFALASGSIIDVQGGTLIGGSFGNEVWASNLSGLAISAGATFDGIESNFRVAGLSGAGSLLTGYAGAGYVEGAIGVDNGAGTFSGGIGNSVNPGSLAKIGTGTQTLSGANTYTGTTRIDAGTLSVTGSLSASSAVTVTGGALIGTGTVGGVTVANVANSVIQGGTGAAGTLTTGALTFNGATAKLRVNTDGTSAISVVAAAAVTLGTVTVDFNAAQNLTAGTFNVITGTSMVGTATQGTLPIGRTWTSLTVVGNNLVAVLA